MNKDRIRKQARERIELGYSRQHVLDELVLEYPDARPKRIARLVRYIPSLAARYHYRTEQQMLLGAIALFAVLELVRPILDADFHADSAFQWFRVVPFATIFLGIAVYRYRGEVYQWLALINFGSAMGLLGLAEELVEGRVDPWELTRGLLSLAICALAWHLSVKLFPDFKLQKDPLGQLPPRIVFPEEPGIMPM